MRPLVEVHVLAHRPGQPRPSSSKTLQLYFKVVPVTYMELIANRQWIIAAPEICACIMIGRRHRGKVGPTWAVVPTPAMTSIPSTYSNKLNPGPSRGQYHMQ